MIRFAIVTPSWNQGAFLERTIRSVLDQGYPDLEYVICDNNSTDGTQQILTRYRAALKVIVESDTGQANAVNKGICMTSGDIIGWLNSDDVYRPGALMTVGAYLSRHPEVDVFYGDADLIDADDNVVGRYYTEPFDALRLQRRPFICQPAAFFRRRIIDRFGILDETLHYNMDYEFWMRLATGRARFAYVPLTLARARVHSATKSAIGGLRIHDELNGVLKRYVRSIPDAWILTHTHALLNAANCRAFRNPFHFAIAVVLTSLRLSLEHNRSISLDLALSSARTLATGAAKTALRMPVVRPIE